MDKYKLSEEIVSKRFSKNDKNYGLYYLCCYGLLEKFGDKHLYLVEKLFKNCNFYIDNKSLKELLESANFDSNFINDCPDMIATCSSGISVELDAKTQKLCAIKNEPQLFYYDCTQDANIDLISVLHESSHILKGLINNFSSLPDDSCIFIRCGFLVERYETDGKHIYISRQYSMLDEVINVLQVADMMKAIKSIDRTQLGSEVLDFFDKLDLDNLDKPFGYDEQVILVQSLWQNKHFKNAIEENIVDGYLDEAIEKIGVSFVEDLSSTLDYMALADISICEKKEEGIRVKKLVRAYNERHK